MTSTNLVFNQSDLERLDLAAYFQKAESDRVSLPVWLTAKETAGIGTVHAVRLPPQQAEVARRRCWQSAKKKGRTPSQDTLYLAEWVMVFIYALGYNRAQQCDGK